MGALLVAALLSLATPGARPGTQAHPVAKGTAATIDGFSVRVSSVNRNAWPRLRSYDSNRRPPAGETYVMVTLRVKNGPARASVPFVNGTLDAVARSRIHSSIAQSCGFIPDDVSNSDLVSAGAAVTQNVCWQVSKLEAPSLVMYFQRYAGGPRIYFSLG